MSKKGLFSSLRGRLFTLAIAAAVPWLGMALHTAWEQRQEAEQASRMQALRLARAVATNEEEVLAAARQMARTLGALPFIREGHACGPKLAAIFAHFETYSNMGVVDGTGRLICDALDSKHTGTFSDRNWFQRAINERQAVVGEFIIGRLSNRAVVVVSYPLFGEDGTVSRVVFVSIDLERTEHVLKRLQLPRGASFRVVDPKGAILTAYPDGAHLIGRTLASPWLVSAIRAGKTEGTGTLGDGPKASLVAYSAVDDGAGRLGAYVVMQLPRSVAFSESNQLLRNALIWMSWAAVLTIVGVWFGADMFVLRQVRQLMDAARRIGRRDFRVRVGLTRSGCTELNELAVACNDMAASLGDHVRQIESVMEVAPDPLLIVNEAGVILRTNVQTERTFGYRKDEMAGQSVDILLPESMRQAHESHRQDYARNPVTRPMGVGRQLVGMRKDGSQFPVEVSLSPFRSEDGLMVICAVRDISERVRDEQKLLHQATHDALTGLPNRFLFRERLAQAIAETQRNERLLAVLFLDLDHFKNINDTLGHPYGDALLQAMADRFSGVLREGDTVARQGGDEFAVLLRDLHHVEDVVAVAEKLLEAARQPVEVMGHEVNLTASIGITLYPFDDTEIDHLLRDADTAMYSAKERGRNTFQLYNAQMNQRIIQRLQLEMDLRRGIERQEFELYYQPQVDIASGAVTGTEALLRWKRGGGPAVEPGQFIPMAEECGLILPIGEWVLRTACRQAKAWQDNGMPPIKIAVNLSARQFREKGLVEAVESALADSGLDPRYLELEITEGMVMENSTAAVAVLEELKHLGVHMSIDDFGTGYSSLSYLKMFPVDYLKIDKSFVREITTDPDCATIARTIIAMAHSMGLRVIAEGVETKAQMHYLRNNGCDQIQGFYISQPLPVEQFEDFLRKEGGLDIGRMDADKLEQTLLIVDDEQKVSQALARAFRSEPYKVLTADNGWDGLDLLALHQVGVVISDQRMPGISGVEFLSRVKDIHPLTVRIMLTGHADFDALAEAVNRGEIYRFLAKPWVDEEIKAHVRDAFRQYALNVSAAGSAGGGLTVCEEAAGMGD